MLNKFALAFLAFCCLLTGCNFIDAPMSTIAGKTDWAAAINNVYFITTVICALVGIIIAVLVVIVVFKFRDKPGDTHMPEQVHGSFKLELLWTIIPCVLLIFILIPTWETILKFDRVAENRPEGAMIVKVIGHQWWWEFEYPEQSMNIANELHLPENTQIYFEITSADVLHSFWIPQLGGKVDTVPGETTHMLFTTPAAQNDGGDYYQGQCVELCGLSHALMRFQAVVHKQDEWERFVAGYNEPPKLETAMEKRGQELMVERGCIGCHKIEGTNAVGNIGPNLTNFGNRKMLAAGVFHNDQESLYKWLKNPPAIKPGSLMQDLNLSDEDIQYLSAYLRNSTLKSF